jgi:hypothetical protein
LRRITSCGVDASTSAWPQQSRSITEANEVPCWAQVFTCPMILICFLFYFRPRNNHRKLQFSNVFFLCTYWHWEKSELLSTYKKKCSGQLSLAQTYSHVFHSDFCLQNYPYVTCDTYFLLVQCGFHLYNVKIRIAISCHPMEMLGWNLPWSDSEIQNNLVLMTWWFLGTTCRVDFARVTSEIEILEKESEFEHVCWRKWPSRLSSLPIGVHCSYDHGHLYHDGNCTQRKG